MEISPYRGSATIKIADFGKGDKWVDRIYHITIPDTAGLFGQSPAWKQMESYFTLRAIP